MLKILLLLLVILVPINTFAQGVEYISTPSDAVGWAATDIMSLESSSRPFQRYVWIPPWGDKSWHGAVSYALNVSVSHANTIVKPTAVANGWLLRIDLRNYAPNDDDFNNITNVWESLATDEPYFHVPQYNTINITGGKRNIAVLAPHINQEHAKILMNATSSASVIYRADWFISRSLSTLNGGAYYKFQGWVKGTKKMTQAEIFATLGAAEEASKKLNGDQRIGMTQSQVTGKPRRVDRIQGLAGRSSTGAIWITHDIFDEDAESHRHPIYNLLAFTDRGREIIFEKNNGLHGFILTDNSGNLADSAPPNLVADHEIPRPYTRNLQGAISCIRCHAKENGLMSANNDVKDLIESGFDVFDDVSELKLSRQQVIDRLSAYGGDFTKRLDLGRSDYADAVFRATDGMSPRQAGELVSKIYSSISYNNVDVHQALLETGHKVNPKDSLAYFRSVIDLENQKANIGGTSVKLADPMIGFLSINKPILRVDFERVYSDLMIKSMNSKRRK